ncbi:MAG: glycosyltransferase [Fibromonadaceae bacterium]|nr:glycosyltransferase [Fibromonadaceae bacterium]
MATYNGEKYITEQVKSILPQLGENDELIVSDDGSTDKTLEILESFNDKRIKIFKHNKQNIKVPFYLRSHLTDKFYFIARNFENALKNATGDYIFLTDQDDVWLPTKVETTLKFLNEDKLVISDAWVVNENLEKQYKLNEYTNYKKGFWKNITRKTPYWGCLLAFTKNIKNFILPIPKNVLTHDFWFGLMSELKFSSVYISEPLILYRRHSNVMSDIDISSRSSLNSIFFIIKYRLFLLLEALKRYFSK